MEIKKLKKQQPLILSPLGYRLGSHILLPGAGLWLYHRWGRRCFWRPAQGGLGADWELFLFFLKLQSSGSIQSRNGRLFPNVLLRKTKQIGVCQGPRGSRGAAYLCVSNSRAGYRARACLQRTHGSQVCSGTSPHGRCQARLRMRHSLGRTDSSPALSIRKHTTRRRKALQRISHQGIAEWLCHRNVKAETCYMCIHVCHRKSPKQHNAHLST